MFNNSCKNHQQKDQLFLKWIMKQVHTFITKVFMIMLLTFMIPLQAIQIQ